MRRADPPAVALADGEGAALAAYADSDVGSSPRSISASGGRPGSLTEEPPPVKWDDSAFARVKLMCSYGGRILPRPHDNQLRYVGGESRIAVVSRGITLSELTAKLSRMFGASVVIKYQLPYEDLDALISVTSDEDLENMMEEYDRLQGVGGSRPSASARLRLFLFPLKLERSQTASMLEMMDNNQSREKWFVEILNGLPVLPHVRSETSSIVSESPDYLFHSNTDTLEEWAAATSYGNSVPPPHTEQDPGNKQVNSVPAAALFGSLLQQVGSNEVSSAPGSPVPPLKHKQFMSGSSSSAPPAVISLLSAMAEAASKGMPTSTQHVGPASDGSTGTYTTNKTRLGSGDGSVVGVPEQRKHVDGEILLTSDKGILTSSVGGVEQLLPAGLMDDDDASQKLSAKGSFDEVCGNPQNVLFDAGVAEPSKVLKGELASESMGQPIFDEEVLPMHTLAQNLNVLQLEEILPSPIMSPSGVSSASAQISPTGPTPQQPISLAAAMLKASADDKLKPQVFPASPRAGAHVGSEDKLMQQNLPSSAPYVMAAKPDVEDVLPRQVSPSLAHFLSSGEDSMVRQISGVNVTKDAEKTIKPQAPSSATSGALPVPSPSLMPPTLHEPAMQKSPAVPAPNYFYQAQALEVPMSAATYAMQAAPGVQLPIMSQTPSGAATNPLPPIAAPFKAANVAAATRPAVGTSRPQSPHAVMAGGGVHPVPHIPQVKTTSPVTTSPIMPTNISVGEVLKGLAPVTTNMSPTTVFSSAGEGVRSIPVTSYPQGEVANLARQTSDPLPSHRMGAASPHLGNQFNVAPAPGIPTRFRAVGRLIQPVAEGIPLQQAPVAGVIADKKAPVPTQRALTSPSMRPPLGPGGQYSFFMADQPNVMAHPAAMGGTPRYNTPPNIMLGGVAAPDTLPFAGANPFVDNFQPVSTYQDVLEVPLGDQQRRPPRP